MAAISSLLAVVAISLVVTRVATVILVATGLSHQAARFQARSAFTGSGFTTSESEKVVDHPLRRRVIMTLMLLGNIGLVASASTLILGFEAHRRAPGYRVLELVAGLFVLVFASRSRWVDSRLTDLIRRILHRYTDLPVRDLAGLLDLSGDYSVIELAVQEGDWVAGRTLAELALREEGIAVLGVTRSGEGYRGAPAGSTMVQAADVLILYGRGEALKEIDHRPAGPAGDAAHREGVRRRRQHVRDQEAEDRERSA